MRKRAVGPAGEDLLGLSVAAVLLFGLGQGERRVGEDRVVPPGGDQLALALGGVAVEVLDPADDEPGGDGPALVRGKGGVFRFRDLGAETQRPS